MIWFLDISPEHWEHIAYFFAGVIFSGVSSGITLILNRRSFVREILNSGKRVQI